MLIVGVKAYFPFALMRNLQRTLIWCIFCLSGCAAQTNLMDEIVSSWIGADVSEVVLSWGPPDVITQVNGAMIYEWKYLKVIPLSPEQRSFDIEVQSNSRYSVGASRGDINISGTEQVKPSTSIEGVCYRSLLVKNNVIVKGNWRGSNCPFLEFGEYSAWRKK